MSNIFSRFIMFFDFICCKVHILYYLIKYMNSHFNFLIEQFLRTFCEQFTARDVSKFFSSFGLKTSTKDCAEFLDSNPLVFSLEGGKYITRAGAFTNYIFSIKPTVQEFEQGILVLGSRCVPFVDSEMYSFNLTLSLSGRKLRKKVGHFDCDLAIDIFQLFGEEYAPQYIASDPANEDLDFVKRDFELPNNVYLTGYDISNFISSGELKKGDRLLCTVTNWDKGVVELSILNDGENFFDRGPEGSMRLLWYKNLEEALFESFERMGPCSTIDDQLAPVFFENSYELSNSNCGSVEEYLNRYAKRVSIEHFGVETRLWYKGQEVPAVGKWNIDDLDILGRLPAGVEQIYLIPPEIIEQYLQNMLYNRRKSLDSVLKDMYPEDYIFHKDEKNYILSLLKKKSNELSSSYNWFADQRTGEVRSQALELFKRVNYLIFRIDCSKDAIKDFPQQELVILTQLYSHLFRIFQSLEEGECTDEDCEALLISLDGMRWNFEDIRESLEDALEEQNTVKFKVVKK